MKKIAFLFLLTGCIDQGLELNGVWSNDERVAKYVDQFFVEAEARGKHIDRSNLIATVVNTPDGKPNPFEPGLYKELKGGQKVVLFDEYIFSTNTDLENEVMIFHELGHWKGLHHCDPCPDTVIMNSHVNFYMYDGSHKDRRKAVLDYFFSLIN